MEEISKEQIRRFRLHRHHLDRWYGRGELLSAAGACGLQNTPPGAWENALFNRIEGCTLGELQRLLEEEKLLVQAWSFRGAPVVFPTAQSGAFLWALVPQGEEPWIYIQGIGLALDFLQMTTEELLPLLGQVIGQLDEMVLTSKVELDRFLAEQMLPLLAEDKRALWQAPSMYGSPEKQTVGGAVVSFLLRPCSYMGLVVFGKREGTSPTYTSFNRWVGRPMEREEAAAGELVRKYLRCYGPATAAGFASWLGCSPQQAKRMWSAVAQEMEPVLVDGKRRDILREDRALLAAPPMPQRTLHLLAGHDPYLGLQDRAVILEDRARQKRVWQTVSNPGAILWEGRIVGVWKSRRKGKKLMLEAVLWEALSLPKEELTALAEQFAAFRGLELDGVQLLRE